MTPHIIIIGNPIDGLEFIGPFASCEEASSHANMDAQISDHEWWTAPLYLPES